MGVSHVNNLRRLIDRCLVQLLPRLRTYLLILIINLYVGVPPTSARLISKATLVINGLMPLSALRVLYY